MIFLLRTCHYEISYNIYLYTYKKKPEDDYSSGFLYIPLSGKCIFCPQFCPHLPTFSGFFDRFSFLLHFLIGSVMRFMRFRIFRWGIVIVQMRTRLSHNPASDFPHNKAIHSYYILPKASKTPTLPTLLPTVTLRKQAKQK